MFSTPNNYDEPLSSLINYLPRTGNILDAGCGPCLYAKKLKNINDNVVCLDLVRNNEINDDGLPFCLGSITNLPIKSNSIDFIYCLTVLQYIEDDANAINEFYRILKPNGKLLITIPTKWSPFCLIREMEIYFDLYSMQSSWNIRPYKYYTRKMIGNLIENKFDIIELKGHVYNFFPRFFLLFLTFAKKNRYFEDFLSRVKLSVKCCLKTVTSQSNLEPTLINTNNNKIRKGQISKISDISYHYLIVLEKR
jgi:SAM-dependent methyltransferase